MVYKYCYYFSPIRAKKATLLPISGNGIFQTARRITRIDNPFYSLNLVRTLGPVLRLPFPIPGASMVLSISDTDVSRKILTDALTTKPLALYSNLNGAVSGYPAINTLNRKAWHDRRKGMGPDFASRHGKRMNAVTLENKEAWIRNMMVPISEKARRLMCARK